MSKLSKAASKKLSSKGAKAAKPAKAVKKGGCGCMEEIAMGLNRDGSINNLLKGLTDNKYDFSGAHVTIVVSIPTGSATVAENRKDEEKDTQLSVHEVFSHHTDPDRRTGHLDLVFKTTDANRIKEIFDDNFKEMIMKE